MSHTGLVLRGLDTWLGTSRANVEDLSKLDIEQARIPARPQRIEGTSHAFQPCDHCSLRRNPGAAKPGYCIGRDDLPAIYGLMHELPNDMGATCESYQPRG